MRRRLGSTGLVSMLGGMVFLGGLLAGCSDPADADSFETGLRTNGIVGGDQLDDGRLVMPHRAVRVTATEVSSSLDEQLATYLKIEDGGLDAADGQEFFVASIDELQVPFKPEGKSATVVVKTEGESHDITADFNRLSNSDEEVVVVASVPTDSPVTLEVADEGKTASLDLRTGKRSKETEAGATGAYYANWSGELTGKLESTGVVGLSDARSASVFGPDDMSISLNLEGATVAAHGWLKRRGWAPSGQGYLVISKVLASAPGNSSGCFVGWSPAKSLTLTPEGGSPVAPIGIEAKGPFDLKAGMAFALPLTTTAGVLTLKPQASTGDGCKFYQPLSTARLPIKLG